MLDEFYGDETLITSHKTSSFSLLTMLAKLKIFKAMKFSINPPSETSLSDMCNASKIVVNKLVLFL